MAGDVIRRVGDVDAGFHELLSDSNALLADMEVMEWLRIKRSVFDSLNKPSVPIELIRDGKEIRLALRPRQTGMKFINRYSVIHALILSFSFLWIGMAVWSRTKLSVQSLVFFLMTMSYALLIMTLAFCSADVIAVSPVFFKFLHFVNYVFFFLSVAFALHFSLLFPRRRKLLARFPLLTWGFYLFNAVVLAVFNPSLIDGLTVAYYVLTFLSFGYALVAYRTPVERQQMKWVAAGFLFSIGPWICINGIPLLFFGRYLLPDTIVGTFFICIPLFIGFAIHKYRLFDLDALFEGTLAYVITIAALGIIDFSFISLLSMSLENRYWMGALGRNLLSALLVVVLYAPMRQEALNLVRRLFRKDRPEEGAVIRSFIQNASGRPPVKIVEALAAAIQTTFPSGASRLVGIDDPAASGLFMKFDGQDKPVKLWEGDFGSDPVLRDMYVALPLRRQQTLDYVLLLGELSTGRFYSRHDLKILDALLFQARLFYENAYLYEENLEKTKALAREEKRNNLERERILKDLHDGLGGITTNISLLAQMGGKLTSPADIQKTFATIAELSADSLSEIRSFLQSMDDSKVSWEILAADLRHFGNRMLEPHDISFAMDCALDGSGQNPERYLCLIVFRIYKETLANVIKHARAKSVRVVLNIGQERLFFSISDDGIGLQSSAGRGRGLKNMMKRAEEIGGSLAIVSDQGTRIELSVPLPLKCPGDTSPLNA